MNYREFFEGMMEDVENEREEHVVGDIVAHEVTGAEVLVTYIHDNGLFDGIYIGTGATVSGECQHEFIKTGRGTDFLAHMADWVAAEDKVMLTDGKIVLHGRKGRIIDMMAPVLLDIAEGDD